MIFRAAPTPAALASCGDSHPTSAVRSHDSFTELEQLAGAFGVSDRMLQIAFGWRRLDELRPLDDEEMRPWIPQGGDNQRGGT